MTIFCFVGDFGWLRHVGVAEDNRDVAFLVFLYTEKGIFFHILSYIFATECQIPVVFCIKYIIYCLFFFLLTSVSENMRPILFNTLSFNPFGAQILFFFFLNIVGKEE